MKKILTILLVSLMVLSLTGCNSKKEEETVKVEESVVQETVKEETPVVEEKPTVEETTPVEVVEEVKEEKVDVTELSYWVNFLNPDGSLISRKAYKYGDTPVYPTNPEYFDGAAYYSFREWDKKLSPVHMTQTYKALYDVTGYVKSNDDTPSAPTPTPQQFLADILTKNSKISFMVHQENENSCNYLKFDLVFDYEDSDNGDWNFKEIPGKNYSDNGSTWQTIDYLHSGGWIHQNKFQSTYNALTDLIFEVYLDSNKYSFTNNTNVGYSYYLDSFKLDGVEHINELTEITNPNN